MAGVPGGETGHEVVERLMEAMTHITGTASPGIIQ
jgi:hypothetical protein